jgi:3-oxoacyl-[acyl-carrier protein] reductase
MKVFDLSGRVALVTGGSRGIGAACSLLLAEAGATIGVNYVANEDAALKTVAAIEALGGTAIPVRGDVSDKDAVALVTGTVEEHLGPIDILVANAGISQRKEMEETTEEDFNMILQANLTSAFLCSQAVIPGMRERGWGRLIYVSSGAAYNGGRVGVHYSAAKGGMGRRKSVRRPPSADMVRQALPFNSITASPAGGNPRARFSVARASEPGPAIRRASDSRPGLWPMTSAQPTSSASFSIVASRVPGDAR